MKDFNSIPTSISHKKLNAFFVKAHKEFEKKDGQSNLYSDKSEEFNNLITKWSLSSEELLAGLNANKKYLNKDKNPNSLMALGAMEVHIKMAIQAFKASQSGE